MATLLWPENEQANPVFPNISRRGSHYERKRTSESHRAVSEDLQIIRVC